MLAPFEVSTDASDTGIGCILPQRDDAGRDQPVLFASKALTNNSSIGIPGIKKRTPLSLR